MEAFLAAVGSMVQYAREDEALQLQTVSCPALTVRRCVCSSSLCLHHEASFTSLPVITVSPL